MSRFFSYINTTRAILDQYKGETPLHAFLKNFFSRQKKFGSRDRKTITALCYMYCRTGAALTEKGFEEKLLTSLLLCSEASNEILQILRPGWNEKIHLPLEDKLAMTGTNAEAIFPFNSSLSDGIDVWKFNASFLIQPDLFLRVRPGKEASVGQKLQKADVAFTQVSGSCLSFKNGLNLEGVLEINREVVIQDLNSQRTGEMFTYINVNRPVVWDCCAASGGKSIMAYDLLPGISLIVSDIRESIVINLRKRFKEAEVQNYRSFVADLTNAKSLQSSIGNEQFQVIICDAPCSGSGTWSRTPEQLLYFKNDDIKRYSQLQKSIALNTAPFLKVNGYFLYITCSVFKQENEEVVEFIRQRTGWMLLQMQLLQGYELKADTLFAALFKKV